MQQPLRNTTTAIDETEALRSKGRWFRFDVWLPNLLVLAALAAIGWWGHASHWTLPQFGGQDSVDANVAADDAEPADAAAHPAANTLPTQLPIIEFASADAAYNCGIMTALAQQRSMDDVVTASGVVGYDQTHLAQLSVRVPGNVWRVEKRLGDTVERGDVLVIVDSAEVGNAKAALLEAAVLYDLKTQNLERLEKLENLLAARELREAAAAREVSRAQRLSAVQKLANMGFPIKLDDIAGLSVDQLAARLQLLGLPASLDGETTSGNLIPLVAPFAGVVTNCEVVSGEVVDPSKTQYTIADTTRMWIHLNIRQEDSAQLKLGTMVEFLSEGEPRPVSCQLTWIGTEIDPRTRSVQARAEVKNPPIDPANTDPRARRLLQANAFGTAHIVVKSNPVSVVVPNEALHFQWEIGREVVFVVADDGRRFEPRVVRKGLERDNFVQVLEGLSEGSRVVTSGSRILSSELSEKLQQHIGDNAEATRYFSGVAGSQPVANTE